MQLLIYVTLVQIDAGRPIDEVFNTVKDIFSQFNKKAIYLFYFTLS